MNATPREPARFAASACEIVGHAPIFCTAITASVANRVLDASVSDV